MKRYEIVDKALENLQISAQIKGRWKTIDREKLDGQIEFMLEQHPIKMNVVVKNNLRMIHIPLIYELANDYTPLIVVAQNIFPKIKEELRKHHIAYLEGNGNIWLKFDEAYLWIDTNKAIREEQEKTNRAFTKTGLKVVFHFLLDENLINVPYREIAKKMNIALGNVSNVLNGLKGKDFILKMNKNEYKFVNKKELLNTWMTSYAEKLKPDLEIGTFRFLREEDFINWRQIPIKIDKTYWGGETAGAIYTNYLKPAILTLYTLESKNELIKNYKLIPDPNGNIKVYRKFWDDDTASEKLVPPLLAYADLMNTGDHRCIETAQKIYDEHLKGKF